MSQSTERRERFQPGTLVCAGGYVLRQREWAERGEECLGKECPHPLTCTTKHRDLQGGDRE